MAASSTSVRWLDLFPSVTWESTLRANTQWRDTPGTLDHEVREFGVRAVLVEPATPKRKITQNEKTAHDCSQRLCRAASAGRGRHVQKGIEHGDEPLLVAEAVSVSVTARIAPVALSRRQGRPFEPTAPFCSRLHVRPRYSQTKPNWPDFMNTAVSEHPTVRAHQQKPAIQKTYPNRSTPPGCGNCVSMPARMTLVLWKWIVRRWRRSGRTFTGRFVTRAVSSVLCCG